MISPPYCPKSVGTGPGPPAFTTQNERRYVEACALLKHYEQVILTGIPDFTGTLGVQISYVNGIARDTKPKLGGP